MTVCEFREWKTEPKRVDVLLQADVKKISQFWMHVLSSLGTNA